MRILGFDRDRARVIRTCRIVGCFEDRPQLTRFVIQVLDLRAGRDLAFDQNEQPVLGFVGFFDNNAQLGDVFAS